MIAKYLFIYSVTYFVEFFKILSTSYLETGGYPFFGT